MGKNVRRARTIPTRSRTIPAPRRRPGPTLPRGGFRGGDGPLALPGCGWASGRAFSTGLLRGPSREDLTTRTFRVGPSREHSRAGLPHRFSRAGLTLQVFSCGPSAFLGRDGPSVFPGLPRPSLASSLRLRLAFPGVRLYPSVWLSWALWPSGLPRRRAFPAPGLPLCPALSERLALPRPSGLPVATHDVRGLLGRECRSACLLFGGPAPAPAPPPRPRRHELHHPGRAARATAPEPLCPCHRTECPHPGRAHATATTLLPASAPAPPTPPARATPAGPSRARPSPSAPAFPESIGPGLSSCHAIPITSCPISRFRPPTPDSCPPGSGCRIRRS